MTVNGLACLGIAITILRPHQIKSFNSKFPPIAGGIYIGDVSYKKSSGIVSEQYVVIVLNLPNGSYGAYLVATTSNFETTRRISRDSFKICLTEDEAIAVGVTMLKDEKERLEREKNRFDILTRGDLVESRLLVKIT